MKLCHSVQEALSAIESNQTVFVHAGAATPEFLLEGLLKEAPRLRNVELFHLHTEGDAAERTFCVKSESKALGHFRSY